MVRSYHLVAYHVQTLQACEGRWLLSPCRPLLLLEPTVTVCSFSSDGHIQACSFRDVFTLHLLVTNGHISVQSPFNCFVLFWTEFEQKLAFCIVFFFLGSLMAAINLEICHFDSAFCALTTLSCCKGIMNNNPPIKRPHNVQPFLYERQSYTRSCFAHLTHTGELHDVLGCNSLCLACNDRGGLPSTCLLLVRCNFFSFFAMTYVANWGRH